MCRLFFRIEAKKKIVWQQRCSCVCVVVCVCVRCNRNFIHSLLASHSDIRQTTKTCNDNEIARLAWRTNVKSELNHFNQSHRNVRTHELMPNLNTYNFTFIWCLLWRNTLFILSLNEMRLPNMQSNYVFRVDHFIQSFARSFSLLIIIIEFAFLNCSNLFWPISFQKITHFFLIVSRLEFFFRKFNDLDQWYCVWIFWTVAFNTVIK